MPSQVCYLLLLLLALPLPSGADQVGRVSLSLAVSAEAPPARVKLHAARVPGTGSPTDAREWEVEAPGSLQLDLAPEASWRLSVEAAGYWAPDLVLPPGERPAARLVLLPTGTITGQVAVQPGEAKPSSLAVRFQSAPGQPKPGVPSTQVLCPIQEGRWRCEVPAGSLDLRLQAEGYVPHYLWGVGLRPGARSDLGRFALARGASLIGWIEVEGTTAEARGHVPTLEVSPHLLARTSSPAVAERLGAKALSAKVNARGFFQLTGVPAGEYVATARLPGFAPARTTPFTVRSGQETELRDRITLHLPVAFEVHLNPPLDTFGQPWQIELSEPLSAHLLQTVGQGPVETSGTWKKEGLAPGSYKLQVTDLAGSLWKLDSIEVAPGMAPIEVDLGFVAISGRITRGKEPLETTLWFGRQEGLQRIRFDSDARGDFAGNLPFEGEWTVTLEREDQGTQTLEPVVVKRLSTSPVAKVEIHVADTRLGVQVVDRAGKPVPKAEVAILSSPEKKRREAQVSTDEKGEAVLRGVAPGLLYLYALAGNATSEATPYRLREEAEDPPARLIVREKLQLSGRVLAPEGPVGGALVQFVPPPAANPGMWPSRAFSGADGSFQLSVDPSYAGGSLAVFAPGFAARLLPAPPDWKPDQGITIPVSQEGGDLVVHLGEQGESAARGLRLAHNGANLLLVYLFLDGLSSPAEDGGFTLPRMEPGGYVLCTDGTGDCVSGTLSPNGALKLGPRESRDPAARSAARPGVNGGPR